MSIKEYLQDTPFPNLSIGDKVFTIDGIGVVHNIIPIERWGNIVDLTILVKGPHWHEGDTLRYYNSDGYKKASTHYMRELFNNLNEFKEYVANLD